MSRLAGPILLSCLHFRHTLPLSKEMIAGGAAGFCQVRVWKWKLFTVLSTTLSYGDITYLTTPKIYFSVVYELYFNMKLSGCFIFLPGGHYHTDGNAQNTASVGWITNNRYVILTGDPSSVWLLHLFHPEKDDSILNRVGKPVIFSQKTSSVLYLLFYQ